MNETTESSQVESAEVRKSVGTRQVCPFCGSINQKGDLACAKCGMEDTPGTRQATRAKVGPWFVQQARNPSAPGMNFATLLSLIEKGRVTARSIVRGPTTHQLWKYAARVKGVSREFGVCWGCGGDINKSAKVCPNCKRLQEPPINPDVLIEGQEATAHSEPAPHAAPAAPHVHMVAVREQPASPMEVAAFELIGGDRGRRRAGRKIFKAFMVAVLLSVIGVAALLVLDPTLWSQARMWAAARLNTPSDRVDTTPQPAGPATTSVRDAAPRSSDSATGAANAAAKTATNTGNPSRPDAGAVVIGPANPATPRTPKVEKPETPKSTDVVVSAPVPMTLDAAKAKAQDLRVEAYNAIKKDDWATAYKCWLEMAKLPREAQHGDLAAQLAECRERLGIRGK